MATKYPMTVTELASDIAGHPVKRRSTEAYQVYGWMARNFPAKKGAKGARQITKPQADAFRKSLKTKATAAA